MIKSRSHDTRRPAGYLPVKVTDTRLRLLARLPEDASWNVRLRSAFPCRSIYSTAGRVSRSTTKFDPKLLASGAKKPPLSTLVSDSGYSQSNWHRQLVLPEGESSKSCDFSHSALQGRRLGACAVAGTTSGADASNEAESMLERTILYLCAQSTS